MTEKLTKLVWDGLTDTWSEIELTAEEVAEQEARAAEFEAAEAVRLAAEEKKAADKAAGIAALKAAGLTDDQISALFN